MANGVQAPDPTSRLTTIELPPEPLNPGQQVIGRATGSALPFEAVPKAIQLTIQLAVQAGSAVVAHWRVQMVSVCRHLSAPGDDRDHSLPCLEVES